MIRDRSHLLWGGSSPLWHQNGTAQFATSLGNESDLTQSFDSVLSLPLRLMDALLDIFKTFTLGEVATKQPFIESH